MRRVPRAVGDDPRRADRRDVARRVSPRQLCQWSSRAQHEVPLLGGEFAWIVMRTADWAEASNKLDADHVPADRHNIAP
jgi:hypothetical protein